MTPPAWRGAAAPIRCTALALLLASCGGAGPTTPVPNGEPVSTPAPASTPATILSGAAVDEALVADLERVLDDLDRMLAELDAELSGDEP